MWLNSWQRDLRNRKSLSARITNDLREGGRPGRRDTLVGRRTSRPLLEVLEDRTLLSTDVVSNTNDSGFGSLRDIIGNASPGDTIAFASNVTGTIYLSSGSVLITQNLNIEGPGADSLTINGSDGSLVFLVPVGVTATIAGLTIADGRSPSGGGIFNNGTLTVTNSTLSGNRGGLLGGGIVNFGALTVTNATLSGNSAVSGGGIFNEGTLTVTNSTLSGNTGGGIYNDDGTLTITNSTLSGNSSRNDDGGGGIYNQGTAIIANTIIAGNTAPNGPDVEGTVTSLGNNLIGNPSGGSGFAASDLLNVNPLLGPLQDNGGHTDTMALLPGSPAIDAGSSALVPSGITTDQRGAPRAVFGGVDIGAFEVQVYPVYFTTDSGGGSLRSALTQANQYGGSIIAFTTSGVIDLASPLPVISRDVQILGPGANSLTVSGNFASEVFYVINNVTATIAGLTIADGVAARGGGIFSYGRLTVNNCTFTDNSAPEGGGIFDENSLTVTNSTFSNNSAAVEGGGIDNKYGVLTLTNSTFSGNSAGAGGGIENDNGGMTITNSTVSGNSAVLEGGGIDNNDGFTSLANTIVATNTAPTAPDVAESVTSLGYNLIGNPSGCSGFVVSDLLNIDPRLSPLQSVGGPTPTMALLPGSPAIGAGSVALVPPGITTDQRGSARIVNGAVDIGAFESRGFTTQITSGNNQHTGINTAFTAPLVVTVSSPYGEPVAGGVVTFGAPASGASAIFPGGSDTAGIDASGQAKIAVAANTIIGSYTVSASAQGNAGASVNLTNTLGPSTQLEIHTQPAATATAGKAFASQPVIYEEDQYGNLETGDNSTQVTAALESGSGPLKGTLTVTVSGGIATFTNLTDNAAGTISLLFTSVPALASAISSNIAISPAQASQLVIRTQPPATATAGKVFATQPVIDEEDRYGNLETGDNSTQVTAALRVGTGPLQGTTTVTVSRGIATFTNLTDNKPEIIVLVFTSSALDKATSNPIVVSPASAKAQLISARAKVGSALVKAGFVHPGVATGKATSLRKNRHVIRDMSLPAATKPHTLVAVTPRPRQFLK